MNIDQSGFWDDVRRLRDELKTIPLPKPGTGQPGTGATPDEVFAFGKGWNAALDKMAQAIRETLDVDDRDDDRDDEQTTEQFLKFVSPEPPEDENG